MSLNLAYVTHPGAFVINGRPPMWQMTLHIMFCFVMARISHLLPFHSTKRGPHFRGTISRQLTEALHRIFPLFFMVNLLLVLTTDTNMQL